MEYCDENVICNETQTKKGSWAERWESIGWDPCKGEELKRAFFPLFQAHKLLEQK